MWWGIKGTLPDNSLKIPNPKSKKDRQHNGKKKIKGQIIIYKILQKRKIAQHEPQKNLALTQVLWESKQFLLH